MSKSKEGVQPFKSGAGKGLEIDDVRSVAIFEGEDGTFMLKWKNGDRETHIRLSYEALQATASTIMFATRSINMHNTQEPLL